MDLFEKFPFNNLLHRRVQTILMDGLESGSSALVSHLLWECDMLDWLAQIDREVSHARSNALMCPCLLN